MKLLAILLTSFIWLPILLTLLIVALLLVMAVLIVLIILVLIPLIWMIKFRHRVQMAYEDLFKELGSNLNDIKWWRLWRLVFRRYKKMFWDTIL